MEIIHKYFHNLSNNQIDQFSKLRRLYEDWNSKINVISRKDISELYTHHILHSLAIAKVVQFKQGTKILDIGTGGGFPGIPLAILFPETEFMLVDSIQKKIKVVNNISGSIKLKNIQARHQRGESVKTKFDFIVSRAVTNMRQFICWTEGKIRTSHNNTLDNGILYLKGGDLNKELRGIDHTNYEISCFFEEDYFKTKKVTYIRF